MHRVISLVLVVLIALVGWRVYDTWSATRSIGEPDVRGKGKADLDLPSTARTPPPPRLAMTVAERDLFDESRKAPKAELKTVAPVPPPNVELIGVLIIGPEPEALIKDSTQGGGLRHVFTGDDVGGYTVSAISATEVVLLSPQGDEVPLPLTLNRSGPPASAGAMKKGAAGRKGQNAQKGAAAAAAADRGKGGASAGVRDRLRELRRQRREANKARP